MWDPVVLRPGGLQDPLQPRPGAPFESAARWASDDRARERSRSMEAKCGLRRRTTFQEAGERMHIPRLFSHDLREAHRAAIRKSRRLRGWREPRVLLGLTAKMEELILMWDASHSMSHAPAPARPRRAPSLCLGYKGGGNSAFSSPTQPTTSPMLRAVPDALRAEGATRMGGGATKSDRPSWRADPDQCEEQVLKTLLALSARLGTSGGGGGARVEALKRWGRENGLEARTGLTSGAPEHV